MYTVIRVTNTTSSPEAEFVSIEQAEDYIAHNTKYSEFAGMQINHEDKTPQFQYEIVCNEKTLYSSPAYYS